MGSLSAQPAQRLCGHDAPEAEGDACAPEERLRLPGCGRSILGASSVDSVSRAVLGSPGGWSSGLREDEERPEVCAIAGLAAIQLSTSSSIQATEFAPNLRRFGNSPRFSIR
jgi:hypothetical protein